MLNETLEILTDDEDLTNLYDSTIKSYKEYVVETVDNYIDSGKYTLAISFLENAVKILPDDSELSELLEDTIESKPIELYSMTITQQAGVSSIESGSSLTDSIGNVYYGTNLYSFDEGAYITIYLGGEYSTLTFVIATDDNSSNDYTNSFNVIGDNEILYNRTNRSKTTIPETVEVDVSGAEWITIQTIDSWIYGATIRTIISNPLFYK